MKFIGHDVYDIFKMITVGAPVWCGCYDTIAQALREAEERSSTDKSDYLIINAAKRAKQIVQYP